MSWVMEAVNLPCQLSGSFGSFDGVGTRMISFVS